MRSFLAVLLSCSLVSTLAEPASAQVGSVQRRLVLKPGSNGFVGPLGESTLFGHSMTALGDLDGNGIGDLAVGAPFDNDGGVARGAVWILRLAADGTVAGEQKISQTQGGFAGQLADRDRFGTEVAALGDVDGDGVGDLAVLTANPDRVWILFLDASGTVKAHHEALFSDPAFVPPPQAVTFRGAALLGLGDIDGDGMRELALSAPRDPDGALNAGAVWILRLAPDGSLAGALKISQNHGGAGGGGFGGALVQASHFGARLVPFGDLDGDGRAELGATAPGSEFLGKIWILHLDSMLRVASAVERDANDYGLTTPRSGGVSVGSIYGFGSWLGDIDGDGIGELALGFPGGNWPGVNSSDGIVIGRVLTDGRISKRTRIYDGHGGLGLLPQGNGFGYALAALGDLDGDGAPELAVGAPSERTSGVHTGAVWILSLDPSAERNGSGVNPRILTQSAEPVYGTPWNVTLDCSGHAPGLAVVFGFSEPRSGVFATSGELLVGGEPLFVLTAAHTSGPTALSGMVPPYSVSLLDMPFHVQGYCTGAPGSRLGNALDVIIGR